jgi:peptidoglycan/LPS O-acetylase OafA/YrhL
MGERLYGLDALRGLAALVVVVFHMGLPVQGAHLAVDFFFMLSGFVMARTYEQRLMSGETGRLAFLLSRYRRLWGWMALGTTIGFGVMLANGGLSPQVAGGYAMMLALVPALVLPATPYLLNPPLWSIFYELLANAAHACGFSRMGRVPLALLALACAAGLAQAISASGFPRGGFPEYHWLVLWRVALGYVLGILIWRLFGDRPPLRVPLAVAVAILPAYCLLVWIQPWDMAPLAFIVLLAPLKMFGGMGARLAPGRLRDAAALAGALSFPVYALHFPLLGLLSLPYGPAVFVVLVLAGWLIYRLRGAAMARPALATSA